MRHTDNVILCRSTLPVDFDSVTLLQHEAPVLLLSLHVYSYGFVSLHCNDIIQQLKGHQCAGNAYLC